MFEIKWDGYRGLAFINDGQVRLRSRRDQDFSQKYQIITDALKGIRGTSAVLDGEIVALDSEGRSNFGALQDYASGKNPIVYYVFDLLYLDGHDLTKLPLSERKAILRRWLPTSDLIRYSDHVVGQGKAFYDLTGQQKLEGIIAKRADSRYEVGKRSQAWLKLKHLMRQEAVIGGFTEPKGGRTGFGALVLGVYDGDELKYIGHTGGGFDDKSLAQIHKKLSERVADTSPFSGQFKVNSPVTWVRPELVCEVQFTEWTSDGHMRHPIFVGLREDKDAKSVSHESPKSAPQEPKPQPILDKAPKPSKEKVKLTHLDKVFWPDEGYTKGDLIEYYRQMSPTILPYLAGRPQSLNRFPNGINGKSFYQKDMTDVAPDWAETVKVHSDSEDRDLNYLVCNDVDTLLYMINLGSIEINPWNSRVGSLDHPDWCVIDLDPEGVDFEGVIEVAQTVHDILDAADIPSYPKTSGSSGIHIYIPFGGKYNYEQTKDFAHVIAQMVNARLPQLTSIERSPAKRQERVYLDYLQNRKGQTLAAPYCVRPKPGMTVSTPLEWEEVKPGLKPSDFTVHNIGDRLKSKGDLWSPVIGEGIDMLAALERLGNL